MLEKNRKKQSILFAIIAIIFIFSAIKIFQETSVTVNQVLPQDDTETLVPNSSLSLITEPNDGIFPILAKINAATSSLDIVMYEFEDAQIEQALVSAKNRGVAVRVILNAGYYGKAEAANQPAYNYFLAHKISVHWAPAYFSLTHQKTMIVNGDDALIMTLNFTPQYYVSSRDFAIDDTNQNDVSAIEKVFDADWNDKKIMAPEGNDLVWSPESKNEMLSLIDSATSSLLVYNEEMADDDIVDALISAAKRGVNVEVVMTDASEWKTVFQELSANGVHVCTYAQNASLYIHAKMILVDTDEVFVGSENFSATSLDDNRELGIVVTDQKILQSLNATFQSDWQRGTVML